MNTIKIFIVTVILSFVAIASSAQTVTIPSGQQKTETFKVWGNCDMCKNRIEKAVRTDGANSADWSIKTKILTVTFDPSKTSVDSISKKLAAIGHDTEKYRADDKAYDALESCCKYERKK